jgi:hypothetical protein
MTDPQPNVPRRQPGALQPRRRRSRPVEALIALALAVCVASGIAPAAAADPRTPAPPTSATATALLSAADLQADVDVLEQAYTRLHPGLYRYNTPAQMAGHFRDLRRALDHDQPLGEAYLAFSLFAAKVRCGHTYPNFYNQPKPIAAALLERDRRVPFEFRWLGERMVITRNLSSDASLVPGTEVLAIEEVPVRRILRQLMRIARADGHNDAKRRASLEVGGNERYPAFDIYLPLFFPQVDERLRLKVRAPDARTARTLEVPALTYAQRMAAMGAPADRNAPVFSLRAIGDDTVVLEMPSWALYNTRWDWRGFLQQTFERLNAQGTRTLILDVRGNEGGLDVGSVLLSYLTERPQTLPQYRRLVRYRQIPATLRPYLDTWDRSFDNWGTAARDIGDPRFFQLVREGEREDADVIAPASPRFTGKVYALVGPTNSSATFEFATLLRITGLGVLVGEPTGGNRRGINGGAFYFLRLPRSGIELDVPLVGQFPRSPQPDAGLVPDLLAVPTIADIASGRDRALDTALAHARGQRQP